MCPADISVLSTTHVIAGFLLFLKVSLQEIFIVLVCFSGKILKKEKRKQKIMSLNKLFIGTLNIFRHFQLDISMSVTCLPAIAVQFFPFL